MVIDISKVKRTPELRETFQLREQMEPITNGKDRIEFSEPVEITGKIENTGGKLIVLGNISARLRLTCSRCLEQYPHELATSFERAFRLTPEDASAEGSEEETEIISGEKLDLTDMIVESILLELPMKQVCSEECKGLCKKCGINLNKTACNCEDDDIDPRFEVLKNYFKS
ncbi:hypothetical protein Tfer_1615 [Thermincola ferriacetica]|uniref:DUF177 domain-containing protein n=2 Tax=Thermincola TaxID=278993 RepID=D5X8Q0_THEPJ|nr:MULTISPECIES: DUF177 domain-containing protein [Thermincola]ADG82926.1 protein of unknown function DUF177 [Thermincola potens JR]KNZ69595.1 hypothetical protein Tfer_1615 [Thermincola ferriacetica]